MIFNIITLFREIFKSPLKYGIVSRAIKNNKIKINLYSYNDFLKENVRIDDAQYGGDSGMVIAYDKASKVIDKVKENSPADKAKLQYMDVILSVENENVSSLQDIYEIIAVLDLRPGDRISIKVWRDGRIINRYLILDSL